MQANTHLTMRRTALGDSGSLVGTLQHAPDERGQAGRTPQTPLPGQHQIQLQPNGYGQPTLIKPASGAAVQAFGLLPVLNHLQNKRKHDDAIRGDAPDDGTPAAKRQCRAEAEAVAAGMQVNLNDGMPGDGEHIFDRMKSLLPLEIAASPAKFHDGFEAATIRTFFTYLCATNLWPRLKELEQSTLDNTTSAPLSTTTRPTSPTGTQTTTTATTSTTANTAANSAANPAVASQALALPASSAVAGAGHSANKKKKDTKGKVDISLLPPALTSPSPEIAQRILTALPPLIQQELAGPAESIMEMLSCYKHNQEHVEEMTSVTCHLIEIVCHGGLPHLATELDGIVRKFLELFQSSHRSILSGKGGKKKDPVNGQLLALLPNNPQFARAVGLGINALPFNLRKRFAMVMKFDMVMSLMKRRHVMSDAMFKQKISDVIAGLSRSEVLGDF